MFGIRFARILATHRETITARDETLRARRRVRGRETASTAITLDTLLQKLLLNICKAGGGKLVSTSH